MAGEPKKISFGFSKISKKTTISLPPMKEKNEVQFIDCLEGNAIKLVDGEEKEKRELVIPLKNANVLRDSMIEALKARKEERMAKKNVNDTNNENGSNVDESRPLTLDEIAAKEILEDLKKPHEIEEAIKIMEIPANSNATVGEKESTLEDYENVPVQEFGLAVLRGMGWNPEKGIGKHGKIVEPMNPVLRPKGMGLGADKVIKKPVVAGNQEELIMKKSSPLKIISGPYKNLYGKIEAFDELPGRIMVRLTLQNTVISISENLVQLVTASEFNKNSKILNLINVQEYHESSNRGQDKNKKKNTLANSEEKKSENIKKREKSISLSPEQSRYRKRRSESDAEENYRKSKDKLLRRSSPLRNKEKKGRVRKSRSRSPASQTSHRKKTDESINKYNNHNKERRRRHSTSSPEQERKSKRERSLSSDSEREYRKLKSSKGKQKKANKHYRSLSVSSDSESDEKSRKKEKRKSKRSSSPELSPDRARKSKKSNKRDEVVTKKKKKKKRHRSSS